MARKNDTPQKAAMRELMSGYLKQNNVKIKDGTDVNAIMRDMMSVILEGALDEEMNEELGYSKYDYRNKETDNSRNGHSQKTMHTSYGDMEIDIPRDRKGEYEPQVVKKYQNTVTQDIFPPGHINPYGDIHGLLYDTSLAAYMEVDGIQEYHCVNLFQWPFLPFLYDRQDFVRDTADGTV